MPKLPRPSLPYHHSAHQRVSLQLFHSGQICQPWRRLYASQHIYIYEMLRNDYTVPTRFRHQGGMVDPLSCRACRAIRFPISHQIKYLITRSQIIQNQSVFCHQAFHRDRVSLSELHLTRLCRAEPVAPALPCADLIGATSRRRVLRLCGWRPLIPSQ
jgi:hypothetical protein